MALHFAPLFQKGSWEKSELFPLKNVPYFKLPSGFARPALTCVPIPARALPRLSKDRQPHYWKALVLLGALSAQRATVLFRVNWAGFEPGARPTVFLVPRPTVVTPSPSGVLAKPPEDWNPEALFTPSVLAPGFLAAQHQHHFRQASPHIGLLLVLRGLSHPGQFTSLHVHASVLPSPPSR